MTMTPEAIMRELEEWTCIRVLRERLGVSPNNVDLIPAVKALVHGGYLEGRWHFPDWYPYSANRTQWQVRRKGAGQ